MAISPLTNPLARSSSFNHLALVALLGVLGCSHRANVGPEGSSPPPPNGGPTHDSTLHTEQACTEMEPHLLVKSPNAGQLVVDDSFVYWAVADGIWRSTLDGTDIDQMVGGAVTPRALTSDDSHLYWTTRSPDRKATVNSIAKAGGHSSILWHDEFADSYGLATAGGKLYFATERTIYQLSKQGGQDASMLTTGQRPGSLAADESFVYWQDMDDQAIKFISHQGGQVQLLVENQAFYFDSHFFPSRRIGTLVAAGEYIYWGLDSGFVRRTANDGRRSASTVAFDLSPLSSLSQHNGTIVWSAYESQFGAGNVYLFDPTEDDSPREVEAYAPLAVAISDNAVYWTSPYGLHRSCKSAFAH